MLVLIAILATLIVPSLMSGRKTADCVRDVANTRTELQNLAAQAPGLSTAEMGKRLSDLRKRLDALQKACCEKAKADLTFALTQAIQAVDAWLLENQDRLTEEEKTRIDANKLTQISGC